MINRTRITVDEATRKVLDQLDTQMAQRPAWADGLHQEQDSLRNEIQKNLRDGFAQVLRQSEVNLTKTGRTIETQIIEQGLRIDGLNEAVQTLRRQYIGLQDMTDQKLTQLTTGQERMDAAMTLGSQDILVVKRLVAPMTEQIGEIGAHIPQQAEQLGALLDSAHQSLEKTERQLQALDTVQRHQEQILQISEKASGTGQRQLESIALLVQQAQRIEQQQQSFGQEMLQALKTGQAALEGIRTEQLRMRDALQYLNSKVEAISRPWWKKIFARNSK